MTVKEVIVVEGKYDKARVLEVIDGTVIDVGGFRVYKDRAMLEYLKSAAKSRGVIILTDSDAAGFKIRNFLKSAIGEAEVRHAYIPAVAGKERRKDSPSAEGLLGVEGTAKDVIERAITLAGATQGKPQGNVKKSDLYDLGLLGSENSAACRRELAVKLGLPPRLSSSAFLDVINLSMSREEFFLTAK